MKCTIPEISWHNRDPVLSLDIQQIPGDGFYRLASGGADTHVLIWHMKILPTGGINVENVSDLQRHERSVNIVRWSPSGQYLASGDDDANIIIWQQKTDAAPLLDEGNNDKEIWIVYKVLRGHKQDVYDVCWSPNSMKLITGSIDNTSILWDLSKGKMEHIMSEHKGFVQGVAWDPKSHVVATLSADRTLRIFNANGKIKCRISKGSLPVPEDHNLYQQDVKYFHDDTLKTYFRRLSFSPDGNLIITPAGCIETENSTKPIYASYIFTMNSTRPVAILPSLDNFTLAIKCCPILFELRADGPAALINLPYRIVIAVATRKAVLLYDTQQLSPFAVVSNMHYACLTDIAWSHDARLLAISSIDGYCSLLSFEAEELGQEYRQKDQDLSETEENCMDVSGCEQLEQVECAAAVVAGAKTEDVVQTVKPKRPNILEQWTIKTPKRFKSENGAAVCVPAAADDAKPIEVRRKPREAAAAAVSNGIAAETEVPKSAPSLAARPIEVRRKPRQTCDSPKGSNSSDTPKLKDAAANSPVAQPKSEEDQKTLGNATTSEAKPPVVKPKTEEQKKLEDSATSEAKPIAVRKTKKAAKSPAVAAKLKSEEQKFGDATTSEAKPPVAKQKTEQQKLANSTTSEAKPIAVLKIKAAAKSPAVKLKSEEQTLGNSTTSEAKPIAVRKKKEVATKSPSPFVKPKTEEQIKVEGEEEQTLGNATTSEAKCPVVKPTKTEEKNLKNSTGASEAKPIAVRKRAAKSPVAKPTKTEEKKLKRNSTTSEAKPIAVRKNSKVASSPSSAAAAKTTTTPVKHNPLLSFLKKVDQRATSCQTNIEKPKQTSVQHVLRSSEEAQQAWTCNDADAEHDVEQHNNTSAAIVDLTDSSVDLTLHLDESLPEPELDNTENNGGDVISEQAPSAATTEENGTNTDQSSSRIEIEVCAKHKDENAKIFIKDAAAKDSDDVASSHGETEVVDPAVKHQVCGVAEGAKATLLEDKNIQNLKLEGTLVVSPGKEKRRIPLITLASPKNKKKIAD